MICNTALSKPAYQDEVQITLRCQGHVLKLDSDIICQWNGYGTHFFYLNHMADSRHKFNAFGSSICKITSIIAQVLWCIRIKKPRRTQRQDLLKPHFSLTMKAVPIGPSAQSSGSKSRLWLRFVRFSEAWWAWYSIALEVFRLLLWSLFCSPLRESSLYDSCLLDCWVVLFSPLSSK